MSTVTPFPLPAKQPSITVALIGQASGGPRPADASVNPEILAMIVIMLIMLFWAMRLLGRALLPIAVLLRMGAGAMAAVLLIAGVAALLMVVLAMSMR